MVDMMSERKSFWLLAIIFLCLGIVGEMDYRVEVSYEQIAGR
jgi:hypothetical protein